MNSISISEIIERYRAGFGYVAINVAVAVGNRVWGKLVDIPTLNDPDVRYADVIFTHSTTNKSYAFGNEATLNEIGQDFLYMGPCPMLSFTQDKNAIITKIDSSSLEVIEDFGIEPAVARMQGILINQEEHEYPRELVRAYKEFYQTNGTYKVSGQIFADQGITEVFLSGGYDIQFVEGFVDTVKYAVTARQTQPSELKVIGG